MSPDKAKNERNALKGELRFMRGALLGVIGIALFTSAGWGYTALNSKVAVVPPEVKRPYEIGSNYGDKDYLADMANYVLQTVQTVSPESVEHNNKVILKMTHPDGYGELKTMLDAAAQRIKKERISTVWVPRKEEIYERDKRVKVAGRLKTYLGDVVASERDHEYLVEFNITSSGRLYVLKVEEVVKPDPRSAGRSAS